MGLPPQIREEAAVTVDKAVVGKKAVGEAVAELVGVDVLVDAEAELVDEKAKLVDVEAELADAEAEPVDVEAELVDEEAELVDVEVGSYNVDVDIRGKEDAPAEFVDVNA